MKRYYVVFVGTKPGIYTSMVDCRAQVRGHKDRKFISYRTLAEAEAAFNNYNNGTLYSEYSIAEMQEERTAAGIVIRSTYDEHCESWSTKAVIIETGKVIASIEPMPYATKNLTEFVAVVAALRYCKNRSMTDTIYVNNITVLNWVFNKKREHFIPHHQKNKDLYTAVTAAEIWLKENAYASKILNANVPEFNSALA